MRQAHQVSLVPCPLRQRTSTSLLRTASTPSRRRTVTGNIQDARRLAGILRLFVEKASRRAFL